MLKDIVRVKPTQDYCLEIEFEDGVCGVVDISSIIEFRGIFENLRDHDEFTKVYVNPELGSICWPNGADLDPDVLYAKICGVALPTEAA